MNRQPWWQKERIILGAITLSVTVLIILMRFLGWFQGLELAIYDRFWSKKAIYPRVKIDFKGRTETVNSQIQESLYIPDVLAPQHHIPISIDP